MDRAWRFIKDRLRLNQNAKVGTTLLRAQIRGAQYEYWNRDQDLWMCTGELVSWFMRDIVSQLHSTGRAVQEKGLCHMLDVCFPNHLEHLHPLLRSFCHLNLNLHRK